LSRRRAATSLALAAALIVAVHAEASHRPRMGGTLRFEIGASVNSLDPNAKPATFKEALARDEINWLLSETRKVITENEGAGAGGPFRVSDWEPGKRVVLVANENWPQGRPYLDSIEIQMARSAHDRLLDLDLDRADIVEIAPEEARRASERGVHVSVSQPDELLALVFLPSSEAADAEQQKIGEAVSRSIDRAAIVNFILQKEGEPAGGFLPQWSSGTAFLFSTATDPVAARNLWSEIGRSLKITLGYDASDSLEHSVAERISVDVRETGGAISVVPDGPAHSSKGEGARLVRLSMSSPNPREALAHFANELGPLAGAEFVAPPVDGGPQQIYDAERAMVNTYRVVPLVWLPRAYGLGPRVRDWKTPGPGEGWPFADVWLGDMK